MEKGLGIEATTSRHQRCYALRSLSQYWPSEEQAILELPISQVDAQAPEPLPPRLERVGLPEWAEVIGVEGGLLVPAHLIARGEGLTWKRTDWLGVIFWYLNGSAERAFERRHGPVHSYAFRLKGWDPRLWERAWVNRIALFLRRWGAREKDCNETTLFGPLPEPEIVLTHDVDAVTKTMAVRLKQAAFQSFKIVRDLSQGRFRASLDKFPKAGRFLFSFDDYWCFDRITMVEEDHGLRSHFLVYGGRGGWGRTSGQFLLDPAYRVDRPRLRQQLVQMHAGGWSIGLHPSFHSWADAESLAEERHRVERALNVPITTCRQHWLRFSWERTWKAQQEAGFVFDTTLGFNDRPAFRNGAALQFHPWDSDSNRAMDLSALPMVIMDSHLYDYSDLTEIQRHQQIAYWVDEIRFVGGRATVLWHQRVMSRDYGWDASYRALVSMIGSERPSPKVTGEPDEVAPRWDCG